jgi:hypothetical protein
MKLLALCGSQRTQSMSGGLLRACRLLNPELAELPPGVRARRASLQPSKRCCRPLRNTWRRSAELRRAAG